MPLLLCRHLDRRIAWRVEIPGDKLTLGCSPQATVPLPDGSLSQREASIERHGDRFLLRDLADQGRVKLGGTVTRETLLRDGDLVAIGRVNITFFESDRGPRGEVRLFREVPPEASMQPVAIARRDAAAEPIEEPLLAGPSGLGRGAWLGILVLCLVSGFIVGTRLTRREELAGETGSTPSAAPPPPAPAPAPPAEPMGDRRPHGGRDAAVDELKKELKEEPQPAVARTEPQPAPSETVTPPPATPEPATPATTVPEPAPPAPVPTGPPAKFELGAIGDAAASRLQLFRLFLDIARRPPTRAEERELLDQPHPSRWQRAFDAAPPEVRSTLTGAPESERERLLGRPGTLEEASELLALVTAERPAAFWLTSLAEYREPGRRRPRPPLLRARSLIVDLLDRPPAAAREEQVVAAALASPEGSPVVLRTLASSSQAGGTASTESDAGWLEAEVFRFLLRAPSAAERAELERVIGGIEASQRRRWLVVALAGLEDYGSY